jgi:hypothetical protein
MEVRKLMGLCPDCGNLRDALEDRCPFCDCLQAPLPNPDHSDKVFVIDLEADLPTVEDALERLDGLLSRVQEAGIRMVKVIHGYGSSGKGGLIRAAFREGLLFHRWADRIRDYLPGESLKAGSEALHGLSRHHQQLIKSLKGSGQGNPGVTILIMV